MATATERKAAKRLERRESVQFALEQAGRVKNKLIQELLGRLNAEPERVLFPKSNLR